MKKKADNLTSPGFGTEEYREYFRTDFVERDGKWKFLGISNGNFYMALVFVTLITIPIVLVTQIKVFEFYFLLLLPIYFVICNLLEYLLHRYPMHHKMKGFDFLFEHVTVHHSFFFNENCYFYEQPRDYMAVFLPLLYFCFISAILSLTALIIYFIAGVDNALFFGVVGFFYYLIYEVMHFSYHAKSGSFVKKIPLVKRYGQLHLLHHRIDLMNNYNFNITFPIFDKMFDTLYKED